MFEQDPHDILDSEPGDPKQLSGVRDTSPVDPPDDEPPEQRPGNEEENPVGIPPKPATSRHHPGNPGHSGGAST